MKFCYLFINLLNLFNLANCKGTNTHLRIAREEKKEKKKFYIFNALDFYLFLEVDRINDWNIEK